MVVLIHKEIASAVAENLRELEHIVVWCVSIFKKSEMKQVEVEGSWAALRSCWWRMPGELLFHSDDTAQVCCATTNKAEPESGTEPTGEKLSKCGLSLQRGMIY